MPLSASVTSPALVSPMMMPVGSVKVDPEPVTINLSGERTVPPSTLVTVATLKLTVPPLLTVTLPKVGVSLLTTAEPVLMITLSPAAGAVLPLQFVPVNQLLDVLPVHVLSAARLGPTTTAASAIPMAVDPQNRRRLSTSKPFQRRARNSSRVRKFIGSSFQSALQASDSPRIARHPLG